MEQFNGTALLQQVGKSEVAEKILKVCDSFLIARYYVFSCFDTNKCFAAYIQVTCCIEYAHVQTNSENIIYNCQAHRRFLRKEALP